MIVGRAPWIDYGSAMRVTVVPRLALLSGLALVGGCYASTPGIVHTNPDDPIVSIGAGRVEMPGGPYIAQYLLHRTARACWFSVHGAVAPMDCCALARVAEARTFLSWHDSASCSAAASTPALPPAPARP